MSGQKENLTPLILSGWVIVLAVSSIAVAVQCKDVRSRQVKLDQAQDELSEKKRELDEWEADLTDREGSFRHDFDVSTRGSDAIPPPNEDSSKPPRKIEIPEKK